MNTNQGSSSIFICNINVKNQLLMDLTFMKLKKKQLFANLPHYPINFNLTKTRITHSKDLRRKNLSDISVTCLMVENHDISRILFYSNSVFTACT